ncbi:transcriptional regulator [Nitrosopumilus cobalaminigenes]|uniref:Transcriptional regulator n=1 Tax=Nitrosopumilus cobalaminigenes TaxID=1470066 RepID=A0A7D5M335_9ARCH|nr:ArsR family transcriptional regulator [Nitrosopumilus cobalaminigenes]QLH02669.1 transcriptional regulator [Nitrosopumilus cobalaminigenes]
MSENEELTAKYFLELASTQRLEIIYALFKKQSSISEIAKQLEATIQEVSRNFGRLEKTGLIDKQQDRLYSLSTFGKMICMQTPSIGFISKNERYFKEHDFGNLPLKFIQRIGALNNSNSINGYSRIIEKWDSIYRESEEYIYNILIDAPYSIEMMDIIETKLKKNIKIKSIFSENVIVPKDRKKILKKYDFDKYIKNDTLEKKMTKNTKISITMNEKQAVVCFPFTNGEIDLSKGFYSSDENFHQWCLDYFRYCLFEGKRFREDIIN